MSFEIEPKVTNKKTKAAKILNLSLSIPYSPSIHCLKLLIIAALVSPGTVCPDTCSPYDTEQ